jgi:hypothetical protein
MELLTYCLGIITALYFLSLWVRNSKGSPWKDIQKLLKDDRDEREAAKWVENDRHYKKLNF